jgi:pimeloyl-ACP methyl ester carboxylesterase
LKSVVLVNTAGVIPLSATLLFRELMKSFYRAAELEELGFDEKRREVVEGVFARLLPLFFGEQYLRMIDGFQTEIIRRYVEYNHCPKSVARLMDAILLQLGKLPPPNVTMAHIRCPVLVVTGREEKIFPVPLSEMLKAASRNVRFHILENAGHSCVVEQRAAFNAALTDFISSTYEVSELAVG